MPFVELHARSAFSFLRACSSPEALVRRAARLDMAQIAVTDRDGVYGSARVHHDAKEAGLRGIVGAELTMEDGSVLPVLVRTQEGYRNLCRMLTVAKLRVPKNTESHINWTELERNATGLMALSGDEEGALVKAVMQEDREGARRTVERLQRIFGKENLGIEIQRQRLRGDTRRVRSLAEIAAQFGLPLIASNGVCHARHEDRPLLDAFTALRNHTTLDEAGLLLAANSQRHLKGEEEMRVLFADLPQTVDNSGRFAERVEFTLENLGYEFPRYAIPAGHDQDSFLREMTFRGARERYGSLTAEIRGKLDYELGVIASLGFSGYFLVVWDIVSFCKAERIMVQGRGSAANSVVCYCLSITNADPIKYKLLFERFLGEGRTSWPDIDLDLPSGDRRERVIQEMYRRFAPYGAAMTANVITYRGRSAMREMGKVLGLGEDVLSRFSDLFANGDFRHTLDLKDQVQMAGLSNHHPRLPSLLKLNKAVYGLPRHLGQHSGGMVLCTSGLEKIVPLEPATMPDRVVVQWDKDDCEDLHIIKVDLLGLGMMAVLEDTLALCAARPGRQFRFEDLPADDPPTYEMMQKADTIGVFQIESRAQQATLPRLKPKCFYDVVIEVAIIRPGPIVGNMVHPYLRRRAGREEVDCIHESFRPFLERTLGVPLFQEQILQMAKCIADFTGKKLEDLRRAMSFHRSEERMQKVMAELRAAMTKKNVPKVTQERVVGAIESFALYGFPESHAISFALLAYASSWLRVHRLAEMTAGLLNNQPMGFYSSSTLVRDAKHHLLRVLPVCVVDSELNCKVVDDGTIRLGFAQLRGFHRKMAEKLVNERSRAPWCGLEDFLLRCELPRDERRLLAKAGALNALAEHRRVALWEVEKERVRDLFSMSAAGEDGKVRETPLPRMTRPQLLQADFDTLGLTVGSHPMALIRRRLPDVTRENQLGDGNHGERVTIAGMVICRQRPGTANGHVFVSLEDETGIANAFVNSNLFEAQRLVITQESFLRIRGTLQKVDGVISVYAQQVEGLPYETALGTESHDFR
jgi:error-prone DNA polymerase